MARRTAVEITVTEMPQYRRLVAFLEQVEQLAATRQDVELDDLVDACRTDLMEPWQ